MQIPTNITAFSVLTLLKSQKTQQKALKATLIILVVYIAYLVAQITWFVVPNTTSSSVITKSHSTSAADKKSKKNIDVSALQKLNLFGQYNKEEKSVEVAEAANAPETRLNLTLAGLVASDNPDNGAAIIEYQGKQETYGINELIKGTRASLSQVLMDRVLIKHSGRLETLMLDGFDYKEPARALAKKQDNKSSKEKSLVDHRHNKQLASTAKELRKSIAQDPSKISDYLKIQPKRKKGEIIGYSLRAGKSPEFFKQAGLQAGDIAVQMNGYSLKAPSEAMQALTEMKQASDISLLVDRRGELIEIRFSLN